MVYFGPFPDDAERDPRRPPRLPLNYVLRSPIAPPAYVPPTLDDLAYRYGKPRTTRRPQDRDLREVAREEYFPP